MVFNMGKINTLWYKLILYATQIAPRNIDSTWNIGKIEHSASNCESRNEK